MFFTITQSWQCWHYCQLCIPIYLQFSSLFAPTVVSKCEIRNQGVHEDYVSRLHALLEQLIFKARDKTKLAMLAFLHCGEIVKNSNTYIISYVVKHAQNLNLLYVTIQIHNKYYLSVSKRTRQKILFVHFYSELKLQQDNRQLILRGNNDHGPAYLSC